MVLVYSVGRALTSAPARQSRYDRTRKLSSVSSWFLSEPQKGRNLEPWQRQGSLRISGVNGAMDSSSRLVGEEWQAWADRLLERHYGPAEYQKIPDRYQGDAGIEGFTVSEGHAYQAYGPEEPLTTEERYRKHRSKMTADVQKFIDNDSKLAKLLGNIKITRWILFVPFFDSREIVSHAAKKTLEVLAADLPYVDADKFRVMVEHEAAFATERDELIRRDLAEIEIIPENISEEALSDWADNNDELIQSADRKIARLPTLLSDKRRREFRDDVVRRHREGQGVLEELRTYPSAYEAIRKAKSENERFLRMKGALAEGSPSKIFQDALEDIRNSVKNNARGVSPYTVDVVAWEAVSDWLLRCPLDFPDSDQ